MPDTQHILSAFLCLLFMPLPMWISYIQCPWQRLYSEHWQKCPELWIWNVLLFSGEATSEFWSSPLPTAVLDVPGGNWKIGGFSPVRSIKGENANICTLPSPSLSPSPPSSSVSAAITNPKLNKRPPRSHNTPKPCCHTTVFPGMGWINENTGNKTFLTTWQDGCNLLLLHFQ